MAQPKTYALAAGTVFTAFAIGYVMQFGLPGLSDPSEPIEVSGIVDTAAPAGLEDSAPALATAGAFPTLPQESRPAPALQRASVEVAAVEGQSASDAILPKDVPSAGFDCAISATAEPGAAAMVALALDAPCHGSERVTVHHNGLMFTETVQPDGTLSLDVPALAETAVFIFSFGSGDGAIAQAQVSSLAFYDRVALQWRGDSGLGLHAREAGADYFADGHVWAGSRGTIEAAARGEGGFLARLGDTDAPEALIAEIYSFPAGTAPAEAEVALSVEAEITASNCGQDLDAQMIERRGEAALSVQDIELAMPECDAVGDFLVLDAMVRDIEVASN
ncbi:hypothetical protein SAMN05421853_101136 [Roseivivax halotolerans]|uniref:Translocase n=1 Tax=Roseivivax halotolerans TaxID=93684 RepID=A0A1I5URX3_9RHOB|nr:translocase [Roseivivax halotolerans]SFP97918.1 hypothetical protein SAMN05421853_101136 [Roseivivax halotolerans]